MPGAFHGEVPGPVWPDEASHSHWTDFQGPRQFDAFIGEIRLVGDPPDGPCPDGLPAKDEPIYRAAVACGVDVLITGDLRDFGPLMNAPERAQGLLIQTVADLLNNL